MDIETAKQNIGKPFKYSLCAHWDVIKEVTPDGYIIGEFIECPCEDARLKQEIPEGLKQYQQNKNQQNENTLT